MSNTWTDIGHTGKARGLTGELRFKATGDYLIDILRAEVLFLRMQGQAIPYFVEDIAVEKLLIKFEGVNSREEATRIAGKVICIETKHLTPETEKVPLENDPYALVYAHCVGLLMVDSTAGELGIIKEIVQYPQQEIALLDYNGKEIMVPLNETFIQKQDEYRIMVDLPEGLLAL